MSKAHSVWAIVVASGKAEKVAPDADTALLPLGDKPVLAYALQAIEAVDDIENAVVVASKERLESIVGMARMYGFPKLKKLAAGGTTYATSLKAGLATLPSEASLIVLMDASRPCVQPAMIEEVIKSAKRNNGAVTARKIDDVVGLVPRGLKLTKTASVGSAWAIQSPMAFRREWLDKLFASKGSAAKAQSDDLAFLQALTKNASMAPSTRLNPQIKTPDDLPLVSALLRG
jgi:2-C-methyl-D-erythritol 4-phosphate cytidylyltransferase